MKKKKQIAIELKKVTKTYVLHHEKPTFSERLLQRSKREVFTALHDVDLKIYKGEKVGIVGKNGAGKTTLLKIITGIATPNKGKVITSGRIVSLIDLEAGFHPDLTGVENIFLNGLIIGMSRKEIRSKLFEIIEFADIGQFIDAPMYTYSAGMKLRLGFSVAVSSDPDILVLDEGITAGDGSFQQKSEKKIEEMFSEGKTILLVSHWIEKLKSHCTRCVWLKDREIFKQGNISLFETYEKSL